MAWCRAYLSAKYLAWPQCKPTSTILGILVFFVFFSAVVNQHLTCINECTFMSICIAYYVNTYMYKCCFFSWKNARAYICTFLEHHFIDDGPFQSVQQWFSWKYIEVLLTSVLFFVFVFDELLCSETLFPSCWRQRKTFFMNTLFFHFLSHLVSCPVFLNNAVSWTVLTWQEER